MAGPYCRYCDRRCFVSRTLPADARWKPGETVHLATCLGGMEHDRQRTGYDHTTATNPLGDRCERCSAPVWMVCCSSHGKLLCHHCYRLTHFVEVCVEGCTACAAEGLPVVLTAGANHG